MGKGRDKRKKHEDPVKAAKRASRQAAKLHRNEKEGTEAEPQGFNNEEAIEVTLTKIRKAEEKKKTTIEKEDVGTPSPRANVVFVAHPLREHELVVFGGELWDGVNTTAYNDFYVFNTQKSRWSQVLAPVNPSPRSSAQGVVYKHFLIVHGGEFVSQSQSQFLHFRDVWRFDFRTYQWEELKTLKGGPSSRSGHRMCLWKKNAVVFGGFYDNSLECRYYNDLWILSEMDVNGRWRQVQFPVHGEQPHERSGHTIGMHQDTLFIYGGYSAEKVNRLKKAEATVHHDLWSTTLSSEQPVWTKIRLGGIPPPIRSGVAGTVKDRKLLLFGGVVDIEAPGGKMMSSFNNDLYSFHMDSQRFYPLVLQPKRKSSSSAAAATKASAVASLAEELAQLNLKKADDESTDDDDDDDDVEADHNQQGQPLNADGPRWSYEVNSTGQITPHRRMDGALCVMGNSLYLFGGQYESGKKEVTISDLYSLNLNTMETWVVHSAQDLGASVWLGNDSDSGEGNSWESGSTVVSAVMMGDHGDDEEDEEDDGQHHVDPNDECAPDAIPAELDMHATPGHEAISQAIDGRTMIKGKKGMKVHKAQLLAQLGAESAVPTPLPQESQAQFFDRTQSFWIQMASEALFNVNDPASLSVHQRKRCRNEGQQYAKSRHEEASVLVEQLRIVEEREKEEAEFFKDLKAKKDREWDEEMKRQQATSTDDDDDNAPAPAAGKKCNEKWVKKQADFDEKDEDDGDSEEDSDDA